MGIAVDDLGNQGMVGQAGVISLPGHDGQLLQGIVHCKNLQEPIDFNQAHRTATISGRVYEDGSASSFQLVRLYNRASGELLQETNSFAKVVGEGMPPPVEHGHYEFKNVGADIEYFVMAFDSYGSPLKNAVVVDQVSGI